VDKIILVGSPNVGKSVLFNCLTGQYATVSNYPGTTVEVTRGKALIGGKDFEVVDTPGMYSLVPISEEERVARNILFNEHAEAVVHVIDAKNIERMLPFTLQLIETGLRVILVLNMMDEIRRIGDHIDVSLLEKELGIPVVPAVATAGEGIDILKGRIEAYVRG
jgi:ferrous iron transport protein B